MRHLSTYYDQAITAWLRSHPAQVVTQFQIAELFGESFISSAKSCEVGSGHHTQKLNITPSRKWTTCEHYSQGGRLFKVQKIIEYFSEKFKKLYKHSQNLSLEEEVIPWRGRLKIKTYNPSKITKYGLLIRMVCESLSGYISKFTPSNNNNKPYG